MSHIPPGHTATDLASIRLQFEAAVSCCWRTMQCVEEATSLVRKAKARVALAREALRLTDVRLARFHSSGLLIGSGRGD
jgi:hypothetical protein